MSKAYKTILVTGGAGFVGTHAVPKLLEKGYQITVLDNLSTGKKENLTQAFAHPNFNFVRGDIRDAATADEACRDADAVVHLAAQIDVAASVADPATTNDINVNGTLTMLQAAAKAGVHRFILASSTAVYGDAAHLPVKEETPLKPISPYAASKAAAEAYCNAFAGSFGIETAALRFFNIYGPKNENSPYSGVITKFMRQARKGEVLTVEGDGEQNRDFIHITDIAKALVLAVEAKNLRCETFNVCTGAPTSVNHLADAIGEVLGKRLLVKHGPARVGDIRFSYGDGSRAAEKLEFKSNISISKGLRLLNESDALSAKT